MARLKLFVFAALVLGLGLARLFLSAPQAVASAELSARTAAGQASASVDAWIAQRRAQAGDLALAVAQKPEIAALVAQTRSKPEAPELATFNPLRAEVDKLTPKALEGQVVLGWVNGAGALFAQGQALPVPALDGFDPALAAPADVTVAVQGIPYRVIALAVPGKGPSTLILGVPLLETKVADQTARALGLASVAVLADGKVIASGGAEKASLPAALKALGKKAEDVVERGSVLALGPLRFPLLSRGDALGGQAPLAVMARHALGTPGLEIAAVASTRAALQPVAQDQARAVEFLAAGFAAFLLFLVLMGSGKKAAKEDDGAWQPINPTLPAARQGVSTPSVAPSAALPRKSGELNLSQPVAAPETNPEDFDFGGALQQMPAPAPAPAEEAPAEEPFDSDRTTAYPTSLSGTTQLPALSEQAAQEAEEEEHDATRVAAIPNELLQASLRRAEEVVIPAAPAEPLPSVAPAMVDSDEVHFQEVFQEFLAVREQCGEAGESLTYEKFAAKLRKNRESLTQKYSCRTVRFQAYVKDGKAALKATPVRD